MQPRSQSSLTTKSQWTGGASGEKRGCVHVYVQLQRCAVHSTEAWLANPRLGTHGIRQALARRMVEGPLGYL